MQHEEVVASEFFHEDAEVYLAVAAKKEYDRMSAVLNILSRPCIAETVDGQARKNLKDPVSH